MLIARAYGIKMRTAALSDHSDNLDYVTLVVFDIFIQTDLRKPSNLLAQGTEIALSGSAKGGSRLLEEM